MEVTVKNRVEDQINVEGDREPVRRRARQRERDSEQRTRDRVRQGQTDRLKATALSFPF